jgi:hypothetical protein
MITLNATGDYLFVFALTAVAGMVGGFAAELLLSRNGETGAFELPARKGPLVDLGGFAPLLIGAVVGVAILIIFPPETTIVTNQADGTTTSFRAYDAVRLVVTSLVAGSAGGSVLSSLQARVTAAVNESRVQFTAAAAEQQLEQLRETATREAGERIRDVVNSLNAPSATGARPRGGLVPSEDASDPASAQVREAMAADAIASLDASLERSVDRGRAAINSAAARH